MLSKDDFQSWKGNEVTYAFMLSMHQRVQDLKETLAGTAGVDPLQDRFICGMIRAFSEVIHVEVDEVIQENDPNA
jgi:hypothetical protein